VLRRKKKAKNLLVKQNNAATSMQTASRKTSQRRPKMHATQNVNKTVIAGVNSAGAGIAGTIKKGWNTVVSTVTDIKTVAIVGGVCAVVEGIVTFMWNTQSSIQANPVVVSMNNLIGAGPSAALRASVVIGLLTLVYTQRERIRASSSVILLISAVSILSVVTHINALM